MNIAFNVLDRHYIQHKAEYEQAALRVMDSSWYILGKEVMHFEENFAKFCGSHYCVGLNSGLDALILAFRALGIGQGDEVIVPANTYIASVIGITENQATPIFVEPDEFYNLNVDCIESSINAKTKAILVVHLYGQASNMDRIRTIAKKHKLFIVEDCAQSHNSKFGSQMTGTFGDIGCFSFYPTKNLGAFGDAGAIVTDNPEIEKKIRMMRNYGSRTKYYNEIEGINSRLDEIQAALLNVKLTHLAQLTDERKTIGKRYLDGINNPLVELPKTRLESEHVYHLFVVRCKSRDRLQKYLDEQGINTQIHYPIPPHLAECYSWMGYSAGDFPITEQYSKELISIPLYNGITIEEQDYVIRAINAFRL